MVINQMFPPEAYIYHTHPLLPFLREHTLSSLFLSSCTLSIPVPNLCAHRDRESRPPEPDALHRDTCSGVAGNQVFGERLPRLLTGEIVFFHSGGSSSWWTFARIEIDYFVFFLVDVRGTALRTSSCTDCGPLLRATHYVD